MAINPGNKIWAKFWGVWYPYVTKVMQGTSLVFMNYGFIDAEVNAQTLALRPEDENEREFAQLYYQLVNKVDLAGKDVLEVSAGHGGGASFVMRYLKPASYTGLERNPKAVAFAQSHHKVSGLRFVEGDAQNIPYPEGSFDVIVNVEASHSYAEPNRFFAEVMRVLKPDGYFVTTDFRPLTEIDTWRNQLIASGMKLIEETEITEAVFRSMQAVSAKRTKLIDERVPFLIQSWFKQFAGVQGSTVYQGIESGRWRYYNFVMQKPIA